MSVEGPRIDVGYLIASGDYRNSTNSGTTHYGPNGSPQFLAVKLSSTADLTVTIMATSTERMFGILQNKPSTGIAADVTVFGVSKVIAGTTTITNGMAITFGSSGVALPYSTAGAGFCGGQALEAPTTAGQIFSALIYGVGGGGPAF